MTAQRLDGLAIAQQIKDEVAREVAALAERGIRPGLAAILVGTNPASRVYVNSKVKTCGELGIYSEKHELPETTTTEALLHLIARLNAREEIDGILVQLPLPRHIDTQRVLDAVDPAKDVDGFHPVNVGKLMVGEPGFVPCTPAGIIELIRHTGIELKGKKAVVVGRSNIVGKPVALLLLAQHCTVTICHSRTVDLPAECRQADVLVAAVGRPEMIKGDWIKPGAVVIDVGINRVDNRLVGDVEFESAQRVAGHITPVPGGVGPMTIAMLMKNTLYAASSRA